MTRAARPAARLAGCVLAIAVPAAWAATVVPMRLVPLSTALGATLLVLAWFDATRLRLPDLLTLSLAAAGLVAGPYLSGRPFDHLLGAPAGFALCAAAAVAYRRVRGREGLGMGDAKLAAAGGAWLGWAAVPAMLLLACLGAGLWLAAMTATRGRSALVQPLPFGIPLAAATWLVWLYGAPQL